MTTNREWLYSLDVADLADWFDAQHVDDNDALTHKSGVRADDACTNDNFMDLDSCTHGMRTFASETDSREKLEADVRKRYTHTVSTAMWPPSANKHTDMVSVSIDTVLGWLDRQAAITANETSHDNPYVGLVRGKQWERTERSDYYCGRCGYPVTDHDSYCRECGAAFHSANQPISESDASETPEIAENDAAKGDIRDFDDSREKLEADAIQLAQNIWHKGMNYANGVREVRHVSWQEREIIELLDRQAAITEREVGGTLLRQDERIAELTAQVDELSQQLINARADCNEYRELFSKALTHAHEIANLQP